MPRHWDFSEWDSDAPALTEWLHENLEALLNEVIDGSWFCGTEEDTRLEWWSTAEGDTDALVTLSAEQFKEAMLQRLEVDYPGRDGKLAHREDLLLHWHRMRAAWGRALDDIDRAVAGMLARPDYEPH